MFGGVQRRSCFVWYFVADSGPWSIDMFGRQGPWGVSTDKETAWMQGVSDSNAQRLEVNGLKKVGVW
jgi:hypothetical protein